MHIVFVHTPMATVPVAEREPFWNAFDIRYATAHPGLRPMKNVLWELPHWMHWLAGVLIAAEYPSLEALDLYCSECTLDGIDEARMAAAIRAAPGDLYLFSPMTPNLMFALQIAALVKSLHPAARTVFGGVVATPLHQVIAAHPAVDIVLFGRGELALPALVRALDGKGDLAGVGQISTKNRWGDVVTSAKSYPWLPVNDIPPPKIDLFGPEVGDDLRYLRQVYALGCPFKCSFCTIQTIGQKADYFAIERVIAEIHAYRRHYGEHHNVYFGDETFTVSTPRTLALCEALKADGTIRYDIQTRLNCLTDDTVLRALHDSGCRWVEIGLESLDQSTQDQHKQRLRLSAVEDTLKRVRDAGLPACSFMVSGFPNQTLDDMRRSIDLAADLIARDLLQATYLFGLVPYPGSDLYEHPERFGMRLLHHDYRYYHEELMPVYATDHAGPEAMHRVFLEGVSQLAEAMSGPSALLPAPLGVDLSRYGAFWQGAHV